MGGGYKITYIASALVSKTGSGHQTVTCTCSGATVGNRYLCVVTTTNHSNNTGGITTWLSGMTKEVSGGSSGGYSKGVAYAIGVATSTSIGIKSYYPFYQDNNPGFYSVILFELS